MNRYVDHVVEEVARGGAGAFDGAVDSCWRPAPLRSIYFGGGTPSLLPVDGFSRILAALTKRFGMEAGAEITVELDPGTFDEDKARELVGLGVNRASVGVQSLDEEALRLCGRGHDATQAVRAIETLLAAGITNMSADLLSAVPGQGEERLRRDIRALVKLGVAHASVYDLQFEPGTPFERRYPTPGERGRPSTELAARLYTLAHEELSASGFEHYEISSYARRQGAGSFRSVHNQVYWSRRPYAAFGNGAASFVAGVRATRPRGVAEYCSWVDRGGPADGLSEVDSSPRDDPREPLSEALMLGLRTVDGVHLVASSAAEADACLTAAADALAAWTESGHAEVSLRRADSDQFTTELRARLLPPSGFLVSDAVIADALAAILSVPLPGEPAT